MAIPFAKFPEFRTREVTPLILIFLLQVNNKADTRVLWFSVKKKKDLVFVLINFMALLRFKKLTFVKKKCVLNFRKNTKKNSFSFCFFLEVGWCFILNKRWKKSKKMSVLFVFFKKNIFRWLKIGKKKTDMSRIKSCW